MRQFTFDVSDGHVLKFGFKFLDVFSLRPSARYWKPCCSLCHLGLYRPIRVFGSPCRSISSKCRFTQSAFETITATCIKTND